MTVATNDTVERYEISGTGPYAFSFRIFNDTDLTVVALSTDDPPEVVPLTYLTHYTVTGANVSSGGSITLTSGTETTYDGYTIDIRSNTPSNQLTSIRNTARFLPEIHEDAYDYLSRQIQDIRRKVNRTVRFSDDTLSDGEMSTIQNWLSKYLVIGPTGELEAAELTSSGAITSSIIGTTLDSLKRTAAEVSAGVTPVNYAYAPGDVRRYGAAGDGATDDTAAIQAALDVGLAYLPNGAYLHSGLTLGAQGTILRGESYLGTILTHTGAGDGVAVTTGAHHCEISNVTLNGNDTMTAGVSAVLSWTNAGWGKLDRVTINAGGFTGAGSTCFILQEASFDFVMSHCQVDGENTAELGMDCRDNGAASGPNTLTIRDTRIQQCDTGLDLEDGNNLVFQRLELAEIDTLGVRVRAPIRTATFVGCRFDWNSDSSIGVQVDSGAQDTLLLNTHWDIGGTSITLLSDSGTRTLRMEGNELIGATVINPSLQIKDLTGDNPSIDFTTSAGVQRGVAQITGSILDFFANAGIGYRVRVNGGDVVIESDSASSITVGKGAVATNATAGFLYVPTCAGTPTGTPSSKTGFSPIVVDTTNHKLYFYDGSWRDAGP